MIECEGCCFNSSWLCRDQCGEPYESDYDDWDDDSDTEDEDEEGEDDSEY